MHGPATVVPGCHGVIKYTGCTQASAVRGIAGNLAARLVSTGVRAHCLDIIWR